VCAGLDCALLSGVESSARALTDRAADRDFEATRDDAGGRGGVPVGVGLQPSHVSRARMRQQRYRCLERSQIERNLSRQHSSVHVLKNTHSLLFYMYMNHTKGFREIL